MSEFYDSPCAADGFTSYRYKGRYGWIMIGAKDTEDALRDAARSTINVLPENLQVWNGQRYQNVEPACTENELLTPAVPADQLPEQK